MAARTNWKLTLYGTNTKLAAGVTPDAYGMTTVNIASLTTPVTTAVFILAPEMKPDITSEIIEDIGGEQIGYVQRRGTFTVESYPFNYDATSDPLLQDIDDLTALANNATDKRYLYVRIEGGSRSYPASGSAYPVTIESWEEAINKEFGTRTLTLGLRHREKY